MPGGSYPCPVSDQPPAPHEAFVGAPRHATARSAAPPVDSRVQAYPPTVPPPPGPPVAAVPGTLGTLVPAPVRTGATDPAAPSGTRTRPRRRRWPTATLVLLTVLGLAASTYLWRTSTAWQERSADYLAASQDLGSQVAATRGELADVQAELAAVRAQLGTAQARIVELADEKAQLGDDREVQRQLADYQERVTDAAGRVALALDQCVQGQNQLIGYMENAAQYDPVELDQYATSVQDLCQTATEANTALQGELAR